MTPEVVIVEYGNNYRYWACREDEIRRDIEEYFAQLAHLWGQARVYVLTSMPYSEENYPTHSDSCYSQVPAVVKEIAGGYENVRLIDGRTVVSLRREMTADPDHLNALGNEYVAHKLYEIIRNEN